MKTKFLDIASIGLTLAAIATTAPAPASAQVAAWQGRYIWEEDVGRYGGPDKRDSVVAFITYTLHVGPSAGATGCRLDGQGFQTNKRILCTVTPQGRSAIVKFYDYGPDNIFDSGYRPGQPLFTLTRGPRGIVTHLQGLQASSRTTPRTGTLFRRLR